MPKHGRRCRSFRPAISVVVTRGGREEVVASIGTSNFCTDGSDSPSLVRRLEEARLRAFRTSSLLVASPCSFAKVSPVLHATAFRSIR